MPYKNIRVPFVGKNNIKIVAEKFREKFCEKSFPINVELAIEKNLKIAIVPVPGLRKLCNSDAQITSNWKVIYVDKDYYLDDRYEARVRYSLAHEVGHLILHKDIYGKLQVESIKDFIRFIDEVPQDQYSNFEIQANIFASHLLLPRVDLLKQKEVLLTKMSQTPENFDKTMLNAYLAIPIAKVFGVSESAAQIALADI